MIRFIIISKSENPGSILRADFCKLSSNLHRYTLNINNEIFKALGTWEAGAGGSLLSLKSS